MLLRLEDLSGGGGDQHATSSVNCTLWKEEGNQNAGVDFEERLVERKKRSEEEIRRGLIWETLCVCAARVTFLAHEYTRS